MELGLQDKVALVTGANRGTGAVIAQTLAGEGATVWVHGPEPDAGQVGVCESIAGAGGQAFPTAGDLHSDAGADAVADSLSAAGAQVDILVNNYGGPSRGSWQTGTSEDWHRALDQNLLSATRMVQRFCPGMQARGFGRIVQLATIGVMRPNPNMPHYYAAKAALASVAVTLSRQLTGTGITVNTVSPGLIHTAEVEAMFRGMAERRDWGQDWAEIERRGVERVMPNPCERMATRQEVADLVAFVVSERAGYLNGAHLRIDGGATGTLV